MELTIYTKRWERIENYSVKKTPNGWEIHRPSIGGKCDKTGKPYFFKNLRQDSVNYSEKLWEYMESLWQQAEDNDMSEQEIQVHLNTLGNWLQQVEKLSPKWF